MKVHEVLVNEMKECGYWQDFCEGQSERVQNWLANMHHYCQKHKYERNDNVREVN